MVDAYGLAPRLHGGRNRCTLQPNRLHRLSFHWDRRNLCLYIDGVGVSTCRLHENAPDSVSSFARLFVWIQLMPRAAFEMALFRPQPSAVNLNARLTCALCHRDHSLLLAPWAACPLCDTWVCGGHVALSPLRRCPHCPNQFTWIMWEEATTCPTSLQFSFFNVAFSQTAVPSLSAWLLSRFGVMMHS